MTDEDALTTRQAAQRLGIHRNTLKRMSPAQIPYFTINQRGDRRYRPSDLEHFRQQREQRGVSD